LRKKKSLIDSLSIWTKFGAGTFPGSIMSAVFSIQHPVVIANLPQPVIQSTSRYVVSGVYGGVAGLRKKKRAELAVGIDGEGVNIYNVRSHGDSDASS
jgi:hypothetical protein